MCSGYSCLDRKIYTLWARTQSSLVAQLKAKRSILQYQNCIRYIRYVKGVKRSSNFTTADCGDLLSYFMTVRDGISITVQIKHPRFLVSGFPNFEPAYTHYFEYNITWYTLVHVLFPSEGNLC